MISGKKTKTKTVTEHQSHVHKLFSKLNVQDCRLEKKFSQAKVCCAYKALEYVSNNPLNVKGNNDEKTCYVTGLKFMTSDTLVVEDKAKLIKA